MGYGDSHGCCEVDGAAGDYSGEAGGAPAGSANNTQANKTCG